MLDFIGDSEIIGSMLIGEVEQKTNVTFRNVDGFEISFNATDVNYDSEVVIFIGWVYKLNTPQSKKISRSQCGKGPGFKQGSS